jgi:ribosomal protein L25 (general stress protein Ctc)
MVTILKTTLRSDKGKSAAAKSRRKGLVPAVVYAHGEPTRELLVDEREFGRLLEEIKGRSPMIDMQIGDEPPIKCIIKSIQRETVACLRDGSGSKSSVSPGRELSENPRASDPVRRFPAGWI